MKHHKAFIVFASLALISAAAAGVVACSSDDTNGGNPAPGTHDSGVTNQPDTSVTPTPDSGPGEDTGPGIDAALPDVGACASDSGTCNSCYTPVQDPVNGCSPYAANCVKFDNTRVPAGSQ